ncbi:MAG: Uma2 family endonuclease [Burkholderiales bacterium]|nr:Uma2 family endonuclease [Burkholderiales bacterium]
MGRALPRPTLSADEFLAWEAGQPLRNEFVAGEVFAMAGGEDRNDTVAGNLYIALREQLRGSACRVYGSDVKLGVAAADAFFYPDLMVTCSAADAADRLVKREPVLVVEVLSPATAAFDRGQKFAAYRMLATLQEYLLVDVDTRRCDLYRRGADGLWVLHPSEPGAGVELASVGMKVAGEALWAEIEGEASEPGNSPPG